jgi:hypothetical protein
MLRDKLACALHGFLRQKERWNEKKALSHKNLKVLH